MKDAIENSKKRVTSQMTRTRHIFGPIKLKNTSLGGLNQEQMREKVQCRIDELCSSLDEVRKAVDAVSDTFKTRFDFPDAKLICINYFNLHMYRW